MNIKRFAAPVTVMAAISLLQGCVSSSAANPSGMRATTVDPSVPGPVSGVGIEGHDIVSMTDQMVRDLLGTAAVSGRATAPRIVIDSQRFENQGSQTMNRNLITERLRVNLNRAAQGRLTFITRENLDMVQQERELKQQGLTDAGTLGAPGLIAGADFRLQGKIMTLDSASSRSGLAQRYNQISFELVNMQNGVIVWSNLYEFSRASADDVVYR